MANTKRTVLICPTAKLDQCVNVKNQAAPITLEEMGVPAAEITSDEVNTTSSYASNQVDDEYNLGTAGYTDVDFSALVASNFTGDFEILIIDMTEGREAFPRRTYTAATLADLQTVIQNSTLEAGDGKTYTATLDNSNNTIRVTYPLGVIAKVAASDGAALTAAAATLPAGYTTVTAMAYLKDAITDQYGRTNRIKFPVIEPDVAVALTEANAAASGASTWDLHVFTKVSEVKFDKNTANSYQDVETFEILVPAGLALPFGNVTV